MKRIYILLTAIFLITAIDVSAQYDNLTGADTTNNDSSTVAPVVKKKVKKNKGQKRVLFGGSIGGGWSTYGGYLEISPSVTYMLTQNLHMGLKLTYIYSNNKYYGYSENYHDYGASILARYHFMRFLYLHAEFQELNFDKGSHGREWIPALFLGGGVYQHIGRAFMHVGLLWNVLDNKNSEYNSPYVNPMLSIGFGVGL